MTENNSTLLVNFGCNSSICKVYSCAVCVNKYRLFTVIKDYFRREISLLITYIFLHRSWKVQGFHLDNTCQNVIL